MFRVRVFILGLVLLFCPVDSTASPFFLPTVQEQEHFRRWQEASASPHSHPVKMFCQRMASLLSFGFISQQMAPGRGPRSGSGPGLSSPSRELIFSIHYHEDIQHHLSSIGREPANLELRQTFADWLRSHHDEAAARYVEKGIEELKLGRRWGERNVEGWNIEIPLPVYDPSRSTEDPLLLRHSNGPLRVYFQHGVPSQLAVYGYRDFNLAQLQEAFRRFPSVSRLFLIGDFSQPQLQLILGALPSRGLHSVALMPQQATNPKENFDLPWFLKKLPFPLHELSIEWTNESFTRLLLSGSWARSLRSLRLSNIISNEGQNTHDVAVSIVESLALPQVTELCLQNAESDLEGENIGRVERISTSPLGQNLTYLSVVSLGYVGHPRGLSVQEIGRFRQIQWDLRSVARAMPHLQFFNGVAIE